LTALHVELRRTPPQLDEEAAPWMLDVGRTHAPCAVRAPPRTARRIAGQGRTLFTILRAGAVAIAESPAQHGL
jgi:hypothetical protein